MASMTTALASAEPRTLAACLCIATIVGVAMWRRSSAADSDVAAGHDPNDDTLYFYHFGRPSQKWMPGLPSNSGFCLKLETYLRMTKTPYQIREDPRLQGAPKGKLPYIVHRGRKLGDSHLIIRYLEANGLAKPLQLDNPQDDALVEPFRVMVESELYTAIVYTRWVIPENQQLTSDSFFHDLPLPMKTLLSLYFRRHIKKTMLVTGMGRHSREDLVVLATAWVNSIAMQLGDKPFLFGSKPSVADASVYGVLKVASEPKYAWDPVGEAVRSHPNLTRYVQRVTNEYFPDFAAP
ncbi:hypothetical protein RI367_000987 [Sorochytrium milnesiophthora]